MLPQIARLCISKILVDAVYVQVWPTRSRYLLRSHQRRRPTASQLLLVMLAGGKIALPELTPPSDGRAPSIRRFAILLE